MADFVSADIGKLEGIRQRSESAVTEFTAIKGEFKTITTSLLSNFKGSGADAFKKETDHILEKIGDFSDVLKCMNEGVFQDIIEAYNKVDSELGEVNRNPPTSESND